MKFWEEVWEKLRKEFSGKEFTVDEDFPANDPRLRCRCGGERYAFVVGGTVKQDYVDRRIRVSKDIVFACRRCGENSPIIGVAQDYGPAPY